jgi:hypothetical protein
VACKKILAVQDAVNRELSALCMVDCSKEADLGHQT